MGSAFLRAGQAQRLAVGQAYSQIAFQLLQVAELRAHRLGTLLQCSAALLGDAVGARFQLRSGLVAAAEGNLERLRGDVADETCHFDFADGVGAGDVGIQFRRAALDVVI